MCTTVIYTRVGYVSTIQPALNSTCCQDMTLYESNIYTIRDNCAVKENNEMGLYGDINDPNLAS